MLVKPVVGVGGLVVEVEVVVVAVVPDFEIRLVVVLKPAIFV